MRNRYYVYILASRSRVLYTGVTNDLLRRVWQHKNDVVRGFFRKYQTHRLVFYECTSDVWSAIAFEKKIKGWRRSKKISLIGLSSSAPILRSPERPRKSSRRRRSGPHLPGLTNPGESPIIIYWPPRLARCPFRALPPGVFAGGRESETPRTQ